MGPLRRRRSRRFAGFAHDRFWWHHLEATRHAPPVYASLTTREWLALLGWFRATQRSGQIGEVNVPAMSMLHGLVAGNGLRRIVQLGHFSGYSSLLLGSMLRSMGVREPGLVSFDIDPRATEFTARWLRRAGLLRQVHLHTGDSAAADAPDLARQVLGGAPELVFVDSSHQYRHTLRELDLWTDQLPVGGLMLLHDTSDFARSFDSEGEGGVRRALEEWSARRTDVTVANLNGFVADGADANDLVYRDGCGLGIVQRVGSGR